MTQQTTDAPNGDGFEAAQAKASSWLEALLECHREGLTTDTREICLAAMIELIAEQLHPVSVVTILAFAIDRITELERRP